jgi:hypothetical protein
MKIPIARNGAIVTDRSRFGTSAGEGADLVGGARPLARATKPAL